MNSRGAGLLARYMQKIHAPFLGLCGVKSVVIAVFVAFTTASIALSARIVSGLEEQIVLPQDSYLQIIGKISVLTDSIIQSSEERVLVKFYGKHNSKRSFNA